MYSKSYLEKFVGKEVVFALQILPDAGGEWGGKVTEVNDETVVLHVEMRDDKERTRWASDMHIPIGKGIIRVIKSDQTEKISLLKPHQR